MKLLFSLFSNDNPFTPTSNMTVSQVAFVAVIFLAIFIPLAVYIAVKEAKLRNPQAN